MKHGRFSGHGSGKRVMGSSTAGRVGGDFNQGIDFGLTDADKRVGGKRHRNSQFAGGGFGMMRRGRRGRRA